MLGESDRLAPQEDSLTVLARVLGAYPNMFFVVREAEIDAFSRTVARLKSAADYERLIDSFGVRRSDERFWSVYDAINSAHLVSDPCARVPWISRAMRSRRNSDTSRLACIIWMSALPSSIRLRGGIGSAPMTFKVTDATLIQINALRPPSYYQARSGRACCRCSWSFSSSKVWPRSLSELK